MLESVQTKELPQTAVFLLYLGQKKVTVLRSKIRKNVKICSSQFAIPTDEELETLYMCKRICVSVEDCKKYYKQNDVKVALSSAKKDRGEGRDSILPSTSEGHEKVS